MRTRRLAVLAGHILLIFLTACSTDSGSGGGKGATETTIRSFTLTDTAQTPISDILPDTAFELHWDADIAGMVVLYHADVYLSKDNALDDTDKKVYGINCGDPANTLNSGCDKSGKHRVHCSIGNNLVLQCDTQQADLSSYLSALPQQSYMFLKVCNDLFDHCEQKGLAVKFN